MFDPAVALKRREAESSSKRRVEGWVREAAQRSLVGVQATDVREVVCRDPNCAPLDTIVSVLLFLPSRAECR